MNRRKNDFVEHEEEFDEYKDFEERGYASALLAFAVLGVFITIIFIVVKFAA